MLTEVIRKLTCSQPHQLSWRRLKSKSPKASKRYSDTLNLPKTNLPLSARGNEISSREIEIQKACNFDSLYNWQENETREKTFILHDGPPYANGKPHVGHAINKILKDITTRYKVMRGYQVHYKPGWDCHGLPIEMKAVSENNKLTPLQIRDKARKFARDAIDVQMEAFRRWGVMADWDNQCYYTYDPQYEASQLEVFYNIYEKGLIYQDFMPVYWSPSSGTALAESELEYNPDHVSKAVYVRLLVTTVSESLQHVIGLVKNRKKQGAGRNVYALIWTTTPWTIPANQAVCVGQDVRYVCAEDPDSGDIYICEVSFVDKLSEILGDTVKVLNEAPGRVLEGCRYSQPFSEEELPFLMGTHVLGDKGTGLVHTAPAHGHDDFHIALEKGLKVKCIVDDNGKYDWNAGKELTGKTIGVDAEDKVIEMLGDHVMKVEDFVHKYPYDWRTKKPVIIRASKQWFVNTKKLKDIALNCLKDVKIYPQSSEHSMLTQLETRTYWCISRQRVWGLPIPVFYHKNTKQPLINRATIDHLKSLVLQHGSDCWWKLTEEELLPSDLVSKMGLGSSSDFVKGEDILDIWFDSGVSWASVLPENQQADLYLEGIDQFGGWFQSSLLTSVAVNDRAPYKSLLVHGFAVDEQGRKMSKSIGNVVDPDTVINGGKNVSKDPPYGVDVLRFWSAQAHLNTTVMIGPSILKKCNEDIFKIRKVMRYLLGNIHDLNINESPVTMDQLWPQDRYMLYLLYQFAQQVSKYYDEYSYSKVLQAVEKFINIDVSSFYCNITKDRLYCSEKSSIERRSSQFVQYKIFDVVCRSIAPILPHFAEELFMHFKDISCQAAADSIFKTGWFNAESEWNNISSERLIKPVLDIKDDFLSVICSEKPSDFDVIIYTSSLLYDVLQNFQKEQTSCTSALTEIMQTSYTAITKQPLASMPEDVQKVDNVCNVYVKDDIKQPEQYMLIISPALQHICERCRRYTSDSYSTPCNRCLTAMAGEWK